VSGNGNRHALPFAKGLWQFPVLSEIGQPDGHQQAQQQFHHIAGVPEFQYGFTLLQVVSQWQGGDSRRLLQGEDGRG
jgi:hypothetical protein